MRIGSVDVRDFVRRLMKEYSEDDLAGLAAELSYRYFLALFPFLIFVAALGSFAAGVLDVADPTTSIMNGIGDALPPDARSVVETQVRAVLDSQSVGLLSFGIIAAVWAASGAMRALIKAMDRVYDVTETRPFWKATMLAVALTLAATGGLLGSVALYFTTEAWGGAIADWLGAGRAFEVTLAVVRWPVIITLLMAAVAVLYRYAPNLELPFRWISPGAIIFTLVWIVATVGFGFYVSHFGSYNKTYGALGGVVVMLVWMYLTNLMLLMGAEINALIDAPGEPAAAQDRGAGDAAVEAAPEAGTRGRTG
jgi:membrane protein